MNPGKNFLVCACIILFLSVINLSVGPVINHRVEDGSLKDCGMISDELDKKKSKNANIDVIKKIERELSECRHRKPMSTLEEMSFVTNLIIGLICFLFGTFGLEKELKTRMGMVGMIFGVFGFIITFLYVIYNGIVFTNYYDEKIYKVDGDSAFAELDGDRYKCFYFGEPNDIYALYAKFSDLMKSQYNYNKELIDAFKDTNSEQSICQGDPYYCKENGYIERLTRTCQKLYHDTECYDYANFDKASRFLASLILSILTMLLDLGLAFCGFMLFKEP